MKSIAGVGRDQSIQAFSPVYISRAKRQHKVPGPALLIEVHPEHLPPCQGNLVKGKDHLSYITR